MHNRSTQLTVTLEHTIYSIETTLITSWNMLFLDNLFKMASFIFCKQDSMQLSTRAYVKPLCKKASNHHANLPLEMYSFTL